MTDRLPPPPAAELATWTPPQVDALVAAISGDIYGATDRRLRALSYIADYRKRELAGRLTPYDARSLVSYEKSLADADARLDELHAEAEPYVDEYQRRPWSRYFHVDNNNGHVHTSMDCSTCYPSTRYAWLTELSGQDEDACVALVGETACTVCMPSAPVKPGFGDGTSGWARRTAEQQAERDRLAAEKLAAKNAKAITDVDGSPLRVDGWAINTLAAAKQSLTDTIWYGELFPGSNTAFTAEKLAERDHIAAAIAHKTGESPEQIIEAARTRAVKRAKRG